MDKITQKDIDWLLNVDAQSSVKHTQPLRTKPFWLRALFYLLAISGLAIFPFFLLIRTAVFFNLTYQWNGWLALGGGIFATILLLAAYILILFRRTGHKRLLLKFSIYGSGLMVLAFCFYGLMYLSSVHAQNEKVRQVYRSMHPILRVATATVTLADGELIITDIERQPEDYAAMGLPLNERSLHFIQPTGYVHAIDLRTKGRNEIRNFMLRYSFELMGLQTLRHVGTGDHLHVSLSTPER